ncbi:MAG: glycosyltransferase family 4 protein [Sphingomonadales bacterium]|nr:glycosyltransferase family 4 protein [Sphingomonadales bacterium]
MPSLRINIILPFPVTKPVGGAKVMYEFANRLQALGHQVTVLHSLKRPFKTMRSPLWFKRFLFWIRGAQRPRWFPLHASCRSLIVKEIIDPFVPDGDLVLSTWWQMSYAVATLSPQKGVRINLVQDFEQWSGSVESVKDSYRLPLHHVAISRWLQELIQTERGEPVQLLPLAIDTDRFYQRTAPAERFPFSVIALYSEEKRKGSVFLLAALEQLKQEFPTLQATLFGVYTRPPQLPNWIDYHQRPQDLATLYNAHAVFMSASLGEGWALPPAEAMASGCAVVCTAIGGHADYAIQEQTALLVPPQEATALAAAAARLFNEESLRCRLATEGRQWITTRYQWDRSVSTLLAYYAAYQKQYL